MPNYDFKSLSDYEFELLVRDLLQEYLKLPLENFTRGRDKGIDLRYSRNKKNNIIVQCKHYSSFPKLIHHLKKEEIDKVRLLNPGRYIFATSLGLTPSNKDDIANIFHPYIKNFDDILGNSALNKLLGMYSDVEENNFKLWLTSKAVLDRVLKSDIFDRSNIEIEKIKTKLKLYVPNKSLPKAQKILKKYHYCIIAGLPGIGKTTLAQILLIKYLKKKYKVVKVSKNIDQAWSVVNSSEKIIFYYDDFLGTSILENKLSKNEDRGILDLIDHVKRSKNKRFLLTTREYILSRSKEIYESFANSDFDNNKCIVDLSDYTYFIRANIFYNHILFSNVPAEFKKSILKNDNYLKVIKHENYNPRIIEWVTDFDRIKKIPGINPNNYFENVMHTLSKLPENPRLLSLGMNGCPEGRLILSVRRPGVMACSGDGKLLDWSTYQAPTVVSLGLDTQV